MSSEPISTTPSPSTTPCQKAQPQQPSNGTAAAVTAAVSAMAKLSQPFDWVRAAQVLGVPALFSLILIWIGYQFITAQTTQAATDSIARQELLKELVQAQIKQGDTTTTTLVRMQTTVDEMRKVSQMSASNDRKVIENQSRIIESQSKLNETMKQDCDQGKELLQTQKEILKTLQSSAKRGAPP